MGESTQSANFICRCEQVDLETIQQAMSDGARSLNDIKRQTRAGMGPCQGIYCEHAMITLLATTTGLSAAEIVPMTVRPPVRSIPLEILANSSD